MPWPILQNNKNNSSKMSGKDNFLQLETRIVEVLKNIYDPEIPVNIYELGLIYEIVVDEALYHATVEDMLDIIQDQEDYLDGLMLFGHNPGMTCLVNDLSDLDLGNLPTCGVVVLQFAVEHWTEIGDEAAVTAEINTPKMHR